LADQQDLTGLRVTLERKTCCCANAIVARVEGDAGAYELRCAECGSRGERLPERAVAFLRSTVRVFGTAPAPIFLSGALTRKVTAMNRDGLFPSKYLKAADLGGKPLVVTIKSTTVEALNNPNGGGQRDKLLLSFVNQPKKLVCNVTNYNSISDVHGDETDNWPGKRIELYPTKASMGGKSFDAIRVRAPVSEALNDEIKF
jgi:hypothetical protein